MTDLEKETLIKRYADAQISSVELRRLLGDVSYGDIIVELAALNLPLPQAPTAGREARIAFARDLMFPH
jgi:hypothetical protein